ncbi:MAG: bifunctional diaminohydroxyphosphoribosylaminopyrimidine deaminase/5-amino-6-(5-phosphoribosylamino)uracil reductase RibD [Clostridiales bacterium]|nr:bifunctional diaminohydroxyphosphoribosylaminopyrimidine deaminase/5-amino-6-(5-phosphoribosylamino)uracil reductase RibD [Clostridiales bacterium]
MNDTDYMRRALDLAKKGVGHVNPNPMVGAVIVKNGRIIGEGYHKFYGGPHAEREALASLTESAEGATLYVTLEPCCHYGKTPPCTEAILEHRLARVVVGALDINPKVAGKGVEILKKHGIQVDIGILKEECLELNRIFYHYIRERKPYVIMKYAMTMDGRIATRTHQSRWITGEKARAHVQETRLLCAGIMVGVGTVIHDNPRLTCRIPGAKNPLRIICDTHLRTPEAATVIQTAHEVPTILATCETDPARQQSYRNHGCQIICTDEWNGHVDLRQLMTELGAQGINSVLLEGGAQLNWSALDQRIVTRVQAYIAPKLFGGQEAVSPISGEGVHSPSEAFLLNHARLTRLGEDYLIESEVTYPCLRES